MVRHVLIVILQDIYEEKELVFWDSLQEDFIIVGEIEKGRGLACRALLV